MKIPTKLPMLLAVSLFVFSCQNEEELTPSQETQVQTAIPDEEQIVVGAQRQTSLTNEVDRAFIRQLKAYSDILANTGFIDDFPLQRYPMYFIQKNNNGSHVRGYVLNPESNLSGATKLGNNESLGLNLYRYDAAVRSASNSLSNGNGLYDFDFNINGKRNYYLQEYERGGVLGFNGLSNINTVVHEAFHDHYQTVEPSTNSSWQWRSNAIQDEANFPITKDLLELQILMTEILKNLPNVSSTAQVTELMKQYLAIKSREMAIDPTSRKFIKNMELEQERLEGSAHYIEILTSREFSRLNEGDPAYTEYGYSALDKNMPFFLEFLGHRPLDADIQSKRDLRSIMAFDLPYAIGAASVYGIHKINHRQLDALKRQTPYEILDGMLNLSQREKDQALAAAKSSVDWSRVQAKASSLSRLR